MDHEGGYYELFRWGLTDDMLEDPRLRELWKSFCVYARDMQEAEDRIQEYLTEKGVAY